MCIHQSWVFPAPKGWDNKICVTEDVTAFGRAWIHPKDSATHIQGIQYTIRYFLCFSPRYVNLKICSIDMEIERRWRFLYFRLYNSVLLWQFVGNVLLRKKKIIQEISHPKHCIFFTRLSVTLKFFDVLISVKSCAVLYQQKEQKVWSKKAVFPFDYSKRYIEIPLILSTHWEAVIWASFFGKQTNLLNIIFLRRLTLNKL